MRKNKLCTAAKAKFGRDYQGDKEVRQRQNNTIDYEEACSTLAVSRATSEKK